ncbi:hypothetical protein MKW94_012618, partial [Papaver nudicaule]|nr:hypothetical protein [Papaver nudicaule]
FTYVISLFSAFVSSSWKDFDGSAEYHQTPKSLDILSLLNLTVEAKGDNSGRNNATDDPALRVSPVNYQLPEDIHKATEIPVLRFSPVNYQLQKDTRNIPVILITQLLSRSTLPTKMVINPTSGRRQMKL